MFSKFRTCGRGYRGAALAAAVMGLGGTTALGQTYTWDFSGTNPTNPVDGATPVAAPWNAGDVRWSDGTTDVAWPNTGAETAVFGNNNGAAGSVFPAFAAQMAGVTFNKPGSGAYNIGGFTGGSVTLTGNNPVVTVNATGATMSTIISGTGGFVKEGTGTLVITQTQNTFTGPVLINAGLVNVVEGNSVTATGAIKGVTRFDLVSSTTTGAAGAPAIQVSNGNGAIGGVGISVPINVTFGGAVGGDYRAGIQAGPNANHTVSGAITTSGSGPGMLSIGGPGGTSSTMTVTGTITLAGAARQTLALVPSGMVMTVKSGIDMTGLPQGGQLTFGGSSGLTLTGSISAGSNVDVVMARSNITTGMALSLPSTGTWGNTFLESGLLVLGTSNGMPASTVMTVGKTGAGGSVIYQMNTFSQTVAGLQSAAGTTGGALKVTNTSALATLGTLTIDTAAGTSYSYGTVAGGATATVEGKLNVTKTGAGAETFTGANTYTGLTTVSGGTLTLGKDAFGPVTTGAGADVQNAAVLVLDYTGATTPAETVRTRIASGAITTTTPADGLHTLGYVDNAAASTVTVERAYYGDLNLDGKVNGDDYALMDRGAAMGANGWSNGDVNYDGTVNDADYLLVDTVYGTSGVPHEAFAALVAGREAQFGEAYVSQLMAAVPEPSLMGVGMIALAMGARRRRLGR